LERKHKPKSLWAFFLWLIWILVASGCATYPEADSYDWCKKNLVDETEIKECGEEVEMRQRMEWQRIEHQNAKRSCLWPHGIWVEPPGHCEKSNSRMRY
jgi:hypothetical protein